MVGIIRTTAVAILLATCGVVCQGLAVNAPYASASEEVRTGEDWMGIYMGGKKIGYATSDVKHTVSGYDLSDEMTLNLVAMGASEKMVTATKSHVNEDLTLKDFEFSLKSGMADMTVEGKVEGRLLKLHVESAGTDRRVDMPLNGPAHLSSDVELMLMRDGLSVGKKMRLPVFDPATLSQQDMDITVEAKEDLKLGDRLLPVYRVREDYAGVVTTAWINPDLGSVKGEGPMGLTFLKETKEQAMRKPEGGYAPDDIIALTSIQAKGNVPDPRSATYMKAGFDIPDASGLNLNGGRQEYKDGIMTVRTASLTDLPHVKLPVEDPSLTQYLAPDAFVQSDDTRMIEKARAITGGETDALKAAKMLNDWVFRSVVKKPTAGIPSALEVLGDLTGDCNEHTVLFTALARAAGIPTKMDAGLVLMDGRFYYHAWPEVYIGRWLAVDPTFGQFPADATHIRLVEGGPDKQVAIVKLVGKTKIEIQESR